MGDEIRVWNGHLSLISHSEIICKMLYERFHLHDEVSIILGNWKSILFEQQNYHSSNNNNNNSSSNPTDNPPHNNSSDESSSLSSSPGSSFLKPSPSILKVEYRDPESLTKVASKLLSLPPPLPSSTHDLLHEPPKMRWSLTEPSLLPSMMNNNTNNTNTSINNNSNNSNNNNNNDNNNNNNNSGSNSGSNRSINSSSSKKYPSIRGAQTGSRFVTSSRDGVVSMIGTGLFECVVFPYFSSFDVPKQEAKQLKRAFGRHIVDRIEAFIRDEYQGEQPPGSAFIIETKSQPCQYMICVSMARDAAYVPQDFAYNSFRAALLTLHTYNRLNPTREITKVLCPAFDAPQVSPFSMVAQMAVCYDYWDWGFYPAGTLPLTTADVREDIADKINAQVPSGLLHIYSYLENLISSSLLETRGIVYEGELTALMSWLDGSYPSPFPRDELARLLISTAKQPGIPPFTLTSAHVYAKLTPTVLEFILDLCRRDQIKIYEDITAQEIEWGESLAQGTSGRVYRGMWRHQHVAIKKFFVADPPLFRNELALISLLRHPNLVECYGGFTGEGSALFVTELMDCNLFELLRTKNTLDFHAKIRLAMDIAEGMAFLHARNIIHRDLKSVNVLIRLGTMDIVGKVCDFGLSRVMDSTAKMTGNVGTVAWIAPEVFQNKKYGEKCDVYSFGVILYEILTHCTPFKEIASFKIPAAVIKGNRPSLPIESRNAPKAYLALMKQCWHHTPSKRPSFPEILATLSTMLPNLFPLSDSISTMEGESSGSDSTEDIDTLSYTNLSVYGTFQELEEQALNEFRSTWISRKGSYNKDGLITDTTFLKCLRARQHSVKAAMKLLKQYVKWYKYLNKRRLIPISSIRKLLEAKILYAPSAVDKENSPIIVLDATRFRPEKLSVKDLMKVFVYALERATESEESQIKGITFVVNLKGLSMRSFSLKQISAMCGTLKNYFPVTVKQILLLDYPKWITKGLALIAPMTGTLHKKIELVTNTQIKKFIDNDNLVTDFGGAYKFDMGLWIRARYEVEQLEYLP